MWSYRIYGKGGGGTVIIPPEAGNLTGIIVSKMPKKTDYMVGESLNLEGLEIKSIYDNDVTGIVTEACTLTVNDPLTVNDTSVKVEYEGFETYFNIKVYAKSLEIPAGTKYLYHFDGDFVNAITGVDDLSHNRGSIQLGKFDKGCGGEYISILNPTLPTVTDLKNGSSLTIQMWIKSNIIINSSYSSVSMGGSGYIRLQTYGNELELYAGNSIKTSDLVLTDWNHIAMVFKSGKVSLFVNGKLVDTVAINSSTTNTGFYVLNTNNYIIDEFLISTEALYETDFEVPTSAYGGKMVLDKFYIDTPPTKTIYAAGETLSLEGAVFKAVYSNGLIEDVTSKCVIENNGPLTLQDDFRTVSYTHDGITKCVYLNVGVNSVDQINPEEITVTPSMETQVQEGLFDKVSINAIQSEELSVTPSTEAQVNEGLFNKVTVNPIQSEEIAITPSNSDQVKEGMFNKVTVTGDSDLIPENIKKDVEIFGVTGTCESGGSGETDFKITQYNHLFYEGARLDYIDYLLSICVPGATNANNMFYSCSSLTTLDVSMLDFSTVTTMNSTFYGCSNITTLDLSMHNVSKVTSMQYLFRNCSKLETLNLTNLSFEKNKSVSEAFKKVTNLVNILGGFTNLGKGYYMHTVNNSAYKLDFSECTLLSYDSLMTVINSLYDLNLTYDVANGGTLYTQSLTLGSTNTAKLTAEEIAIATNKGWTVS